MVKIDYSAIPRFEEDYFNKIGEAVLVRLSCLRKSIGHLLGETIIDLKILFDEYSTVTWKIVNCIDKDKIEGKQFNIGSYITTVENYISNDNSLDKINLEGLRDFLDEIITPGSLTLKSLLLCSPDNLLKFNNELLNKFGIQGENNRSILKLAFDYTLYTEISVNIKGFFREKNIVKYCPYCNLIEVSYTPTLEGNAASVHQLDHFFDKASFPLLSYSLFNLVPADSTCNGPLNKGQISFNNEFYLNPYIDGFEKSMTFIPELNAIDIKIERIELSILAPVSSARHKQLIGERAIIEEDNRKGNIGNLNVFKLTSRYNNAGIKEEASKAYRKIHYTIKGRKSNAIFLNGMELQDSFDNYKAWYEEELRVSFEAKDFSNCRYSKLFRDIHDFILLNDVNEINQSVRDYIRYVDPKL